MSRIGGMLRRLRRDCWGCDNKFCGKTGRCTCGDKTDRAREKRQWKKEASDE